MLSLTNLRKPLYTNNSLVFYKRGRNRNHCCKFAYKVATNLKNVVPSHRYFTSYEIRKNVVEISHALAKMD